MEDTTLKKYFDDLTDKIDGLRTDLKENDGRQRAQYKKVIILEEHQKQLEKDAEENKKNMHWRVNLVVPAVTAIFLFVANYFIPKSG